MRIPFDWNLPPSYTGLIVDDDPAVLQLTTTVLMQAGYDVLSACSVDSALGMVRAWNGPLDFLLTDFEMGPRTGIELAAAIRRIFPRVRTVLMSGSGFPPEEVTYPIDARLSKPFMATELKAAIARVMGRPTLPLPLRRDAPEA